MDSLISFERLINEDRPTLLELKSKKTNLISLPSREGRLHYKSFSNVGVVIWFSNEMSITAFEIFLIDLKFLSLDL